MFNSKRLQQKGAEKSTNIQAETILINQGLSYKDVKEIASEIFHENYLKLKDDAAQIAKGRAEEITVAVIDKLIKCHPESLNEFRKPSIQDALFLVQKEYAKSGDEDLGKLLVDIIVDRINSPTRDMNQLLLDEALRIVPRLTLEQINILTLNFLVFHTRNNTLKNLNDLKNYVVNSIYLFTRNIYTHRSSSNYNYLKHLGCGELNENFERLENKIRKTYVSLFSTGFSIEDFDLYTDGRFDEFKDLMMPCLNDPTRYQIKVEMDDELVEAVNRSSLSLGDIDRVKSFSNNKCMENEDIKKFLLSAHPNMKKIFEIWEMTSFRKLKLTNVGITIAYANYVGRTGDVLELSEFIN